MGKATEFNTLEVVPSSAGSSSLFGDDFPSTSPSIGWVTAHCDGGARGNPGPAGYGAVLQDSSGRLLAELSEFLGIRTNNYAEYAGLLACLQWALEQQQPRLRVVSDSLLMVRQIQGRYKVNSPDLRPLWEQARGRIAQLDRFEITHALRHKNKDADRLANQAMDRGTGRNSDGPRAASAFGEVPARATLSPGTAGASGVQKAESQKAETQNMGSEKNLTSAGAPPRVETAVRARTSGASPTGAPPGMLRGFTRDGAIHLLGGHTLPDGIFVKVIPE